MAGQLAKIIAGLVPEHPDATVTGFKSHEVGEHKAGSQTDGKLDPDGPDLEGLTGKDLADAMVLRYGAEGFGFPYEFDTAVGKAQSKVPSEHARNEGGGHEHGMPDPSPATLQKLGFPGTALVTTTDRMDYNACYKFQELVAEMNDELAGAVSFPAKSEDAAGTAIDARVASLYGGRFEVRVTYTTSDHKRAIQGNGTAYPELVAGQKVVSFWFFEETAPDLMVKIVGPDAGGYFWVIVGSLTAGGDRGHHGRGGCLGFSVGVLERPEDVRLARRLPGLPAGLIAKNRQVSIPDICRFLLIHCIGIYAYDARI